MATKEKMVIARSHFYNRYVAVEGEVDDWACYVGARTDSIEHVKDYGDKISEEEARELFPEFENLRWRA
jgi:hypothetical protein